MAEGPAGWGRIQLIDAEAGGDVSRVILGGVETPPGATVAERMYWLRDHADDLRRFLLYPPRGEPSMSANLVVPAGDPAADAGFIIMEAMGYPFFSGSNAMCTAAVLLDQGRVPWRGRDASRLVLESPAGSYALTAYGRVGDVRSVSYPAPAAFVLHRGRTGVVPGHGRVAFDVVYGGVFYAVVTAGSCGLRPGHTPPAELTAFAAAFVEATRPSMRLRHPDYGSAGPLAFVLFVDDTVSVDATRPIPIAAYVHPGVICHGPSGTGTSALLAWLAMHGRIAEGAQLRTVSPEGGLFEGRLLAATRVGSRRAALDTEITGHPRILGTSELSQQ